MRKLSVNLSDLECVDEYVDSFPNELGEGSDFERFARDSNTPPEEGEFCQGNPVRLQNLLSMFSKFYVKDTSFPLLHYHNHRYSGKQVCSRKRILCSRSCHWLVSLPEHYHGNSSPSSCQSFVVTTNDRSKKRLVLDLRHINPHLHKWKFKCEDVDTAVLLLNPGDFLLTFDIKSAYHHVEIFKDHQTYLGFQWFYNGKFQIFYF